MRAAWSTRSAARIRTLCISAPRSCGTSPRSRLRRRTYGRAGWDLECNSKLAAEFAETLEVLRILRAQRPILQHASLPRQPEGEQFAPIVSAADGHDDVLFAVQQVRHR